MKTNIKKYLLTIITIFVALSSAKSQYQLRDAYPNLPAFSRPVAFVFPNDSTNRVFVPQLKGKVYVFNNSSDANSRKQFLDIGSRVAQIGSESGLLGLVFHPDYKNNRYFYVHYVFDSTGSFSGEWIRIARYTTSAEDPDSAIFESQQILMTIPLPDHNHNGGQLAFGADNYLYIALGDGYSGPDLGQDKTTLLGKILRINVDSAANGKNYSIPPTNPFYENTSGWKQEIYAYGLRNPWRFSFDPPTGRLWAGDVGQFKYEEINTIELGKNYGWKKMEGFHCYPDTNVCDTAGRNFTLPVWEYIHTNTTFGNAVVGGYVYRGTEHPELTGKYIYGDYGDGTIYALTYDSINPTTNQIIADSNFIISSFGIDQNNELYVCRYSPTNGRIMKLYNSSPADLSVKVIIEGYYDPDSLKMNLTDTIKVYLHLPYAPFSQVDSAVTTIDSLSFSGNVSFKNVENGLYYLRIKHRNCLETWSETTVNIRRGGSGSYDFTNEQSKTFGNNSKLVGNVYCMISGDCDQNGVINAADRAIVVMQAGIKGYLAGDLDGNGIINEADREILISNIGDVKFCP